LNGIYPPNAGYLILKAMLTYKEFKRINGVEKFNFRHATKSQRWIADSKLPIMLSRDMNKSTPEEVGKFLAGDVFVAVVTKNKEGVAFPEPLFVVCRQGYDASAEG
jgi:hypothetical protein